MKMMILCYCNGIRTRKFDISRSYQPLIYNDFAVWRFRSQDVVADVQSRGIVAEEELQLLSKPNPVSTPEGDENQCRKAGYGQSHHHDELRRSRIKCRFELKIQNINSFWDSRKEYKEMVELMVEYVRKQPLELQEKEKDSDLKQSLEA
ncbi:hypothetical protein Bca101_058675 [Brassica carinata]